MAPTTPTTVITFSVRNTDSKNITTSMFHRMPGVYVTPQLKPLSDFPPIAPQLLIHLCQEYLREPDIS